MPEKFVIVGASLAGEVLRPPFARRALAEG
jgi:hypothetical protein